MPKSNGILLPLFYSCSADNWHVSTWLKLSTAKDAPLFLFQSFTFSFHLDLKCPHLCKALNLQPAAISLHCRFASASPLEPKMYNHPSYVQHQWMASSSQRSQLHLDSLRCMEFILIHMEAWVMQICMQEFQRRPRSCGDINFNWDISAVRMPSFKYAVPFQYDLKASHIRYQKKLNS